MAICIESYLQSRGPLKVVGGDEVVPPEDDDATLKIKVDKALFAINTIIEDELLKHIRGVEIPKAAWDTFKALFSKKNDTRL